MKKLILSIMSVFNGISYLLIGIHQTFFLKKAYVPNSKSSSVKKMRAKSKTGLSA
ncbi:MAG: hypothetical protein K6A80_10310 [Saccharofermentans sp.]|nr:hypothetical protein [Saccharofermentans sp.]